MTCWEYPLRTALEFFNNCKELIKIETKSLKKLWGVHFSTVWNFQPTTLLNSFTGFAQALNKLLGSCNEQEKEIDLKTH